MTVTIAPIFQMETGPVGWGPVSRSLLCPCLRTESGLAGLNPRLFQVPRKEFLALAPTHTICPFREPVWHRAAQAGVAGPQGLGPLGAAATGENKPSTQRGFCP